MGAATTYLLLTRYAGSSCDGTPYVALALENATCSSKPCSAYTANASAERISIECTTDHVTALRKQFADSKYVLVDKFKDENCNKLEISYAFPALGSIVVTFYRIDNFSYSIARLNTNGLASIQLLNRSLGASDALFNTEKVDKETLACHSCSNRAKWYSSLDDTATGGLLAGTILEITLGVVGTVVLIVLVVKCWRKGDDMGDVKLLHDLLNDDFFFIVVNRLPRDKILLNEILSGVAYGGVYTGTLKHYPVTIKMLRPSRCKSLQHVRDFLSEAKMTATLDHPRIVSFSGVAWDSLLDLCVVLDLMNNGDLRSLLDRSLGFYPRQNPDSSSYLRGNHVLAFTANSSDPSRSQIPKCSAEQAKLSDFGISREQMDQTMTAGVGTSLWMAPEVMMGEQYDVKADMFSFGVLLSEQDVMYCHTPKRSSKFSILKVV
ncbi:Serine/threonine-protein kinase STY17 [Phytophthora citrophthora]|uniref:Serine/threonine-protein kinase STY17 n=1 Tax=Phytophthora citrophthora TaxID=4793 RepID=A0AAD9FZ66_9STRA|nr:Serine/threonine-protein kinase STY17 [Phytophthora citrophthora]